MLAVAGDLVEDIVIHVHEPVRWGSDAASTITRQRGGSAANVAAFAASTGAPVRFIGCVGGDATGRVVTDELEDTGVDVRVQQGSRTGAIAVVVDRAGERTMFPSRGACAEMTTVDPAWCEGVEILHLPLYGFDGGSTPDALRDLAATVRAAGGRISVDVSSVRLAQVHGESWVLDLIDGLDPTWVSANADEVALLGLDRPSWLASHPDTTLLARAGADPTRVMRHREREMAVPVSDLGARALDTTGAGDAFAAGFLASILGGESLLAAVERGHALAGRVITSVGASLPVQD